MIDTLLDLLRARYTHTRIVRHAMPVLEKVAAPPLASIAKPAAKADSRPFAKADDKSAADSELKQFAPVLSRLEQISQRF